MGIGSDILTLPGQHFMTPRILFVLQIIWGSLPGCWICPPGPKLVCHYISSVTSSPSRIPVLGSLMESSERLKACLIDTQDSLQWWTQTKAHNYRSIGASA